MRDTESWGTLHRPAFEPLEPRLLLNGVSAVPDMPDLLDAFDTGVSQSDDITRLDNSDPSNSLTFSVSGVVAGATVTVYADSTAIGSVVASDVTALVATDGAYDLTDGAHAITARQTEPARTESDPSPALSVTIDTTAPLVTAWGLDPDFSGNGKLTTSIGPESDYAEAMAIQADGKIVVVGNSTAGTDSDFALVRYNADGSLDTSFDIDGKLTTDFGDYDVAYAVAIQADGKIVVAGKSFVRLALARYNTDGSLDTSFGIDGKLTTSFGGGGPDCAYAMAIQSDGKIVVAGSSYRGTTSHDFLVARYNADGSLDTSFDGDGSVHTGFWSGGEDRGRAVAIQPNGKIVVAGSAERLNRDRTLDFALVRYNADGSLDTSFSGDGKLTKYFGSSTDIALAVAIQSDTKIVAAGYSYIGDDPRFALVRVHANGASDTSFGGDGRVNTEIGNGAKAWAMAIQSDGRIVAAGAAPWGFPVAQYNPDGSLDTSFSGDGIALTKIGKRGYEGRAVAIQPDGKIVMAGYADNPDYRDFVLARYGHRKLDLQAASDTGISSTDNITNDSTPTFSAIGASPYFRVYRDGVLISGGFESGSTYTCGPQPDGVWQYSLIAVDDAGNESPISQPLAVTIDTASPPAPPQAPDLQAGSDLGVSDTDNITKDNTPTFDVTGGSPYFRIYCDGTLASEAFETGSSATLSVQPNGTWDYTATAVDAAGNESAASSALTVTISTQSLPTPGPVDLQAASDTGVSSSDDITNDNTPTFDVSVAAPYFRVYRDGSLISGFETGSAYTAPVQPDGTWSYTVKAADEAGNESAASPALSVTIDTVAPPAQPWGLDPNFDGDGKVTTEIDGWSIASDMAIQSDGKIVVAGNCQFANFALARYNVDGSLDPSFDGDGILAAYLPGNHSLSDVAILPDGKIVVAGGTYIDGYRDFALVWYNADGSLDTSFDGDGILTTDFGGDDYATAMAVQSDGKIVLVGYTDVDGDLDFALARYNGDGSLDTTFDGDGKLTTPIGTGDDHARALAIQSDGKIVVAGYVWIVPYEDTDFALVRYNADGSLDTSFDGDGKVITAFGTLSDTAYAMAIQPDGKIVVAGATSTGIFPYDQDFALARYNPDGSLDTSFDGDGKLTTAFAAEHDDARAYAVAIQSDGKIVAAGFADMDTRQYRYNDDFALARYNADGSLDTSFDGDGKLTTDLSTGSGTDDGVYAVAIQPDGRIVAAGHADAGYNNHFGLARYGDSAIDLQATSDTGLSDTDNITGDDTPTFDVAVTSPYFRFHRDGALISDLYESGSSYTTASQPEGTFSYSVSAVDAAGNVSPQFFPLNVTFVYGQIAGQVFDDLDGDGMRDGVEVGINGWTVELVDPATGGVIASAATASEDLNGDGIIDPATERGRYRFAELVQDDYEVRQVVAAGWQQTAPMGVEERAFAAEVVGGAVTIHEFDVANGAILNSFAGPQAVAMSGYQGLAVGPASLFYVDANNLLTPTLWELDLDTGAVIDSDPLTFGAIYAIKGLAYLDGLLYIQYMPNLVAVWDPASDSFVQTLTIAAVVTGGLTGAGDLGVLFDSNAAGEIIAIDPTDGSVLSTFATGLGALDGGLAYVGGELLAVGSGIGNLVHRIDPSTGAVVGSFALGVTGSVVGLGGDMANLAAPVNHAISLGPSEVLDGQDFANLAPTVAGDFNGDGLVDALDIDLLYANQGDAAFDLDGDNDADSDDVDFLIHDILNTEYGDTNLDGLVNATDLAILKANFASQGVGWSGGDLNGSGLVNVTDLSIMAKYFGFESPGGALSVSAAALLGESGTQAEPILASASVIHQLSPPAATIDSHPPLSSGQQVGVESIEAGRSAMLSLTANAPLYRQPVSRGRQTSSRPASLASATLDTVTPAPSLPKPKPRASGIPSPLPVSLSAASVRPPVKVDLAAAAALLQSGAPSIADILGEVEPIF